MLAGFAVTAVWMRLGEAPIRRFGKSIAIVALAAGAILACTAIHATWDVSENRYNSFSESDERALRQIRQPLRIEVHLAPEDPRRVDLERVALSKLRRVFPKLQVDYVAATTTGLFEQTRSGYGEIWYKLGSQKTMSRITTEEGVLESIYSIAAVQPPAENDETVFRGHPLAARPRGAAALFFVVWPTLTLIAGIAVRRSFV
jgi:hypothetical protein